MEDLCRFWFGPDEEARPEWFNRDATFDESVVRQFEDRIERCRGIEPSTPDERLGLILLFDQVPRHVYRGDVRSFAYDHMALKLAKDAWHAGERYGGSVFKAYFAMLPFEHSEGSPDQRAFVAFLDDLATRCEARYAGFVSRAREIARRHLDIIERFGRFPHRNEVLGRQSTTAELEYLRTGGAGF